MSKSCRTCAKDHLGINVCHLFDNSGKSKKLLHMIKTLTGLELQRLKYTPDTICAICQLELEHAFEFRMICLQAQKTLLHQADDLKSSQRNFDEIDLRSEEASDLTDLLNEVPLMDEPQLMKKLDEIFDKLVNSNGKTDYLEDATPTVELGFESASMTAVQKIVDTVDKECLNIESKRGKRITRYICEQCGQGFSCRISFDGHINRHNGVNPYECDLCPQKFNAMPSLKRHKLKHAGIQPYPCRFCDRRFLDYYLRLRHERMHNNIRPFKCKYCDKAFTTNTHLRNHILTHTNDRAYSCDICQQKFTFKRNVATHYKSTRHKRNEEKHKALQFKTK